MSDKIEDIIIDDSNVKPPVTLQEKPEVYPLREPSEDPKWAVRIIWTWVCIAIFLLLFFVVLLILGIWYD